VVFVLSESSIYVDSQTKQELGEEDLPTTDVLTIDALNSLRRLFFAKLFYPHVESTEELVCSILLANP
jgi:hypothetical protein